MTPANGGKYELRLGTANDDSAEYEVYLHSASSTWRATARVGAGAGPKQVEFGAWQADTGAVESAPPAWLVDDTRAALKAALRTSQAEGRFPRRLTRWRPEPSG